MLELSEHAIQALQSKQAIVRVRITWTQRGGHARLRANVDNESGEPLEIDMHISHRQPWKYSLALLWHRRPIKRLDVRGSHTNDCDGTRQQWRSETHKHAFSDHYELARAYTPEDIPDTPPRAVGADEYRRVFEAFCQECGIESDVQWNDPDLRSRQLTTMEDLP